MNFSVNEKTGLAEGFCLIKSIELRTSTKGGAYLDLVLCDKSGEISAKLWDYDKSVYGEYSNGDIVKIRGMISKYNGVDQLRIDRIRHADLSDDISANSLVKSSRYDSLTMFEELIKIVSNFENKEISRLVQTILEKYKSQILYCPAAFKLHHAIRGGLLFHTLSIVRLAENVCNIYPFINRDLLLAGAILHDVAKIFEFEISKAETAIGYTTEGNLIGHITKGAMIVEQTATDLSISNDIKILLEHMILSHHGEPDFGAAVRPQFIEAEILSELDLMDSRIYEMAEALSKTKGGDFSEKLWALDNRKLYNHSMNGDFENIKLFD